MRFVTALGASLALHVAIGLVSPGQLSTAVTTGRPDPAGAPAPLWVSLGPVALPPAQLATSSPHPASARPTAVRPAASAPALANVEAVPQLVDSHGDAPANLKTGGAPGLPEPIYFQTGEVTTPARILSGYAGLPKELARDVASGRMIILLFINEQGTVDKLLVERNEIRADVEAIIAGQLQSLRFSPAIKGDQPVKSRMRMEITLQPPGPFMPPGRTSAKEN